MNSFYKQEMVKSVLLVVLGLLLLFKPGMATKTIAYVIAAIFIINGIIHIVGYIRGSSGEMSDGTKTYAGVGGLVIGVLSIVFAFMIGWVFVSFIPIMLGIVILINGIVKMNQVMELVKMNEGGWLFIAILAVVNIAIGVVAILNPFDTANLLIRVIGIGFLYGGITDLIAGGYVSGKRKY
jgi:uncharacterized membrane protein HdeD (DUF308 family)